MSYIEGPHPLLEARSPPFSNATVRRAFIVWMHCGQRNTFKDVCNYYHHLENLEEKLPADRRASSRHHEFNMFSNPPPTSPYLDQIYPKLYSQNPTIHQYIKKVEAIKNENTLFNNDSFNMKTKTEAITETVFARREIHAARLETSARYETSNCNEINVKKSVSTPVTSETGVTTNEILDTSRMIKKYCKSHMIPVTKFLVEFQDYARKCDLNYTVRNVAFYIKRKMVEEELLMVENYSKSMNFLNLNFDKPATLKHDVDEPKDNLKLNYNKAFDILKPTTVESPKSFTDTCFRKMTEEQLKFLTLINSQKLSILSRDKKDSPNKYWNDWTPSYEMKIRNIVTRI